MPNRRIHSYVDTQISRLGGPNFHEIPINSSIAPVFNNQRDGMHRQAIHRGRASYEPNSLGGGYPHQNGMQGYTSYPRQVAADMVRGKPELFLDHYSQARQFWISQSPTEQAHIISAYRFELTRVQMQAVRARCCLDAGQCRSGIGRRCGRGSGNRSPRRNALASDVPMPDFPPSGALSLMSRPGALGIRTRRIAIMVAPGVKGEDVRAVYEGLLTDGAVPRLVGSRLGKVDTSEGNALDVEISLEAGPSALYDALVLMGGAESLEMDAHALEFVRDQYRHCKPILSIGSSAALLEKTGIPPTLPDGGEDHGLISSEDDSIAAALNNFKAELAAHRVFDRETDPPRV